jgi:hypothetical protein
MHKRAKNITKFKWLKLISKWYGMLFSPTRNDKASLSIKPGLFADSKTVLHV